MLPYKLTIVCSSFVEKIIRIFVVAAFTQSFSQYQLLSNSDPGNSILITLKNVYGCFVCLYVCAPSSEMVSPEGKRGSWIPWSWAYRWLCGSWEQDQCLLEEQQVLFTLSHLSCTVLPKSNVFLIFPLEEFETPLAPPGTHDQIRGRFPLLLLCFYIICYYHPMLSDDLPCFCICGKAANHGSMC